MATKKAAKKKGAAKGGAAEAQGGIQFNASDRKRIDDASKAIAQAVKRAVATQQQPGSRIRSPIILGIWYNPRTREIEIINQFEQF